MTGPTDPPEAPDVSPMPPEPAPGNCPHCGAAHRSSGQYQKDGDCGVCAVCFGTVIWDAGDWRTPTYDEAEQWDRDARIIAMRKIWAKDDPGP